MTFYPDSSGFTIRAEPDNLLEQETLLKWLKNGIALKQGLETLTVERADRLFMLRFQIKPE